MLRYPIFAAQLSRVLPALNIALAMNVVGHFIALVWNRYALRQVIEIVLHAAGLIVAIVFLRVFPFDYSALPLGGLAAALPTITMLILVLVIVGNIIEIIVHLVRLVASLSTR